MKNTTIKAQQGKAKGKIFLSAFPLASPLLLFILILLLTLLCSPMVSANPQITLISQVDPVEYGAAQTIRLNITATSPNASITQALISFDGQNHTLEKEQSNEQANYTTYIYSWVPAQRGTNTYTAYATDSLGQSQSYTNSFQMHDTTPPEIISAEPNGLLNYNLIDIQATTNENSTCRYDFTDISYGSMTFGLSGEGTAHSKLRSFGYGITIIYIKCKDSSNNIGQSRKINFTIDTSPPSIYDISPTGTVTQEKIELRLYTDEPAKCRWDTESKDYENLAKAIELTGSTFHEQKLTLSQGINRYYISCKDLIGNFNTPIVLNLELNLPPTASIRLDKNSTYKALRQGMYSLELEASEPLAKAPELKLRYSNRLINIPLEGSSGSWKGYLIMPDDAGEQIGEFQYQGTDLRGMVGTEITSGKLIIIDTKPPSFIPEIGLANQDNKIRLNWNYEGEEAHHFNIYRSTAGKTSKSDFYATAPGASNTYFDTGITNKIGYFYMVSAVDQAGNEGPLSEERFLMAEFQNITGFVQEPTILSAANNKIFEIERKAQGIELIITRLESTTEQDLLWLINNEGIVASLKETKGKLQLLIGELKAYKETRMTLDELNSRISIIDAKLSGYEEEVITGVSIANKVEREQPYSESLVLQAVEAYGPIKSFSEYQKQAYLEQVKKLQQETRRIQQITAYELEYKLGEKKRIVVIKEKVVSSKALQGVVLQEAMPSEIIKLSELEFVVEPDDINLLGALWKLNRLEGSELAYKVVGDKELNLLQEIKTVLLYDADAFLGMLEQGGTASSPGTSQGSGQGSGMITGQVAKQSGKGIDINTILLAAGVILVLSLLGYYFVFLRTEAGAEQGLEKRLLSEEQELISGMEKAGIARSQLALDSKTLVGKDGQNMLVAEQLVDRIQDSYLALERGDLAFASQSYSQALGQYSLLSLSLKKRMKVNLHLNTLRERILGKGKF